MKLVIQIPCYNEEKSLPITISHLPRQVTGFDSVEWLVINDGSTDRTVEVAKSCGVDYIVNIPKHVGLARGFTAGLDACLKVGADVIVNLDADNQYDASCIPDLVNPILEGKAEIVIGERPIDDTAHFSFGKKLLQKAGSAFVRFISKTKIKDAPSGFRAIHKEAAMKLNVFNEYTYTLETILQAGQKNMAIISVPIKTNEDLRPSRLIKGIFTYIKLSIIVIIRIFVVYKPFRFFMIIGTTLFIIGLFFGAKYLFNFLDVTTKNPIRSLILCGIFIGAGMQVGVIAFIADLLSVNRKIMEEIQYRMRKMDYSKCHEEKHDLENRIGLIINKKAKNVFD